jgi:rod shape-determining protein MreC
MTVLNNEGLVGRVIRATRTTATVLLIIDADSVVGGRLGSNMEVGFLRGRGDLGEEGRLDLDLVDNAVTPGRDDILVTWGSDNGAPYVPGIPVGRVTNVFSSPRELSKRAVIDPLVDFSSLDLVGVVVDGDTVGDRTVIKAGEARDGSEER